MKIWFPSIRVDSGADVYVTRLASVLRNKGIAAEITWFEKYFEFSPIFLAGTKPPPGTDIIHANSWNAFAFKRDGIPLVATEHHCVTDPAFRPYKSILQHGYHELLIKQYEKASFRKADAIIAVSKFTAGRLHRIFGLANATVIHNWVDTKKFNTRPGDGNNKGVFKLLFVGNQSRRKGWDLVGPILEALGSGYRIEVTSGLRKQAPVDSRKNIVTLGRLHENDLVRAYQDCDALLFPSRYEGFGYVALEAMACGKPVIAANNSALPEVVADGITGILCAPDDIDCYVTACRKLKQDQHLREAMGGNGRKRALEVFSEEVLIQQYLSLYEALL